jgi:hypothetical protein
MSVAGAAVGAAVGAMWVSTGIVVIYRRVRMDAAAVIVRGPESRLLPRSETGSAWKRMTAGVSVRTL